MSLLIALQPLKATTGGDGRCPSVPLYVLALGVGVLRPIDRIAGLTPELHPFFAGTYFPHGRFRGVRAGGPESHAKLAQVWKDGPERCRSAGQQVIEQLREATEVHSIPVPHTTATSRWRTPGSRACLIALHGGFGRAPRFLARSAVAERRASPAGTSNTGVGSPQSAEEVLSVLEVEPQDAVPGSETAVGGGDAAAKAPEMAVFTLGRIYAGGVHDHVGGGVARYSVDARVLTRKHEQLYLLSPINSPHRAPLLELAHSIVEYLPVPTRAAGGLFSAEDADSLPAFDSTKTREGAFHTWTADEIDVALAGLVGTDSMKAAEVFRWAYGVEEGGNCDPQSDPHGELKGQNVLYLAHTHEETAQLFGISVAEADQLLQKNLAMLKEWREKHRPRPHLDDKVVAGWNSLVISGLARASEVFPVEKGAEALRMAEGAARFMKERMYDSATGGLCRNWREGKGPQGVADDYAFLIQGLLDLYETSK
ncbi:hypothetical protein FOMPIDRAFT_86795 [Fomitopsis schrenkii]|uniref:Uncharacterized protein n=1 Tax=Fomitopsis schrenkii TaxID=2126942 RepID=S8ENM6_FOMSC|nr:hypothetical protein FOMPIDRAFT_86795 [Fomitopsis schrenkii]